MGDKSVGFVGLGIMGKPMVRNLMAAGYSLTVYRRGGERHGGNGDGWSGRSVVRTRGG